MKHMRILMFLYAVRGVLPCSPLQKKTWIVYRVSIFLIGKSLNKIRFDGWTIADSFINDYLFAFRRYMDAWLQGKKMDGTESDPSVLEPYRERLSVSGKFAVHAMRPFSFGGLLYGLISIDDPGLFLRVWIYSIVDDGHIDEYIVEYVEVHDLEEKLRVSGKFNKDEIRQFLLESYPYPLL